MRIQGWQGEQLHEGLAPGTWLVPLGGFLVSPAGVLPMKTPKPSDPAGPKPGSTSSFQTAPPPGSSSVLVSWGSRYKRSQIVSQSWRTEV